MRASYWRDAASVVDWHGKYVVMHEMKGSHLIIIELWFMALFVILVRKGLFALVLCWREASGLRYEYLPLTLFFNTTNLKL
jgi:hypothetical protein